MAGIDRIYGTLEEYDQLRDYLTKERPDLLYFIYPRNTDLHHLEQRAISSFSFEADEWLYKHCPLCFVKERIEGQYNGRPR